MCMGVFFFIAHNHAIRLCHASHYYMLSALVLITMGYQGINDIYQGYTLYTGSSYVSPQRLALPYPLLCYSLGGLGRHILSQRALAYAFCSCHPTLPRFPSRVNNSSGVSCAFPPFVPPPRSRPSLPVLGLSPSA